MKMRLHIPVALHNVPLISWFAPLPKDAIFRSIGRPTFFENDVERVESGSAQAIVLPNNFTRINPTIEAYIKRYADLGERYRISVFLFSFGDFTDRLHFDSRVRVFRLSVYRSSIQPQDIAMPTFAEDYGSERAAPRSKQPVPTVSFCGMGAFPSWTKWFKYYVKILISDMQAFADSHMRARKIGVYWRRAMMQACRRSALVATNFIVRRSFSGLRRTIGGDPETMRKEFIDSIVDADFVLAPKGDGNYSNRFLETLSLGRIPVLADTEVVLPLEDEIEYAKIIVRVPMNRVADTPRVIRDFYDTLTEEEWRRRQQLARKTFEQYLQQDAFFRHFFAKEFSGTSETYV